MNESYVEHMDAVYLSSMWTQYIPCAMWMRHMNSITLCHHITRNGIHMLQHVEVEHVDALYFFLLRIFCRIHMLDLHTIAHFVMAQCYDQTRRARHTSTPVTSTNALLHPPTHAHTHTHIHIHTQNITNGTHHNTCGRHTCTCTRMHAHAHPLRYTHAHAHVHTHARMQTHTQKHTHTHTHTRTNAQHVTHVIHQHLCEHTRTRICTHLSSYETRLFSNM